MKSTSPLSEFLQRVDHHGYNDFVSAFASEPPVLRLTDFIRTEVPAQLATLLSVFYIGQAAAREALESAVGFGSVETLIELGLLEHGEDEDTLRCSLRLEYTSGISFFVGRPGHRFPFYFGDDSLGLLRRQRSASGWRALDLCTGTGIQALRLASMGADALGVDLNPFAIRLARLNADMNGLADRLEYRQGNLWAGLKAGERFDWISANPPLLPTIEGGDYPLIGDGGLDGMSVVWRILDGLDGHLTSTGQAIVLGETWSDGVFPSCLDKLREIANRTGLSITMTVIRTFDAQEGAPWHEGMAQTYAIHGKLTHEQASAGLTALLAELGASHVVSYFLNIRRVQEGGEVHLVDLSAFGSQRIWEV